MYETIRKSLESKINIQKKIKQTQYFQAFSGGYGEGDQFLGITVPQQRAVAKLYYKETSLEDICKLFKNKYHEYRLTALFLMVLQYKKTRSQKNKSEIVTCYLQHINYVNNWDLVDSSASQLLGDYLLKRNRNVLYKLSKTNHLWKQRIAIVATQCFIKNQQFEDTIKLSKTYLTHSFHLIHKATGWMLREIGKQNLNELLHFLDSYYLQMPRTMLRYAIEHLDPNIRKYYLASP